jgi:DNA-binding NarL/FixJ family response regulator
VVLRAHRPAVLVLDAAGLRDLAEARELVLAHPRTHVVLLGGAASPQEIAQLLAFGVSAYLDRDTQARDVLSAVHLASRGLQLKPRRAHDRHAAGVVAARLTAREGDVLLLLREGRTNAQIAVALHIGVETVRTHARSVFRKLGVTSRRALLALPGAAPPVTHPSRARRAGGATRAR